MSSLKKYSIKELADLSGIPARTIRYYVQIRLLPPPEGRGRGRHYVERHLSILKKIDSLRGKKSLQDISLDLNASVVLEKPDIEQVIEDYHRTSAGIKRPPVSLDSSRGSQTEWTRVELLDGMEIQFRSNRYSLNSEQTLRLKEAVSYIIDSQSKKPHRTRKGANDDEQD